MVFNQYFQINRRKTFNIFLAGYFSQDVVIHNFIFMIIVIRNLESCEKPILMHLKFILRLTLVQHSLKCNMSKADWFQSIFQYIIWKTFSSKKIFTLYFFCKDKVFINCFSSQFISSLVSII